MAKKGTKKKKLSSIVAAKKAEQAKQSKQEAELNDNNPFERKQVRKHHTILGQKLKGEEIHLGQARSKSIEQRKNTLKLEYELEGKRNAFIDRRIGEKDEKISSDEKMLIRFQKERQKKLLRRKSIYALGEEEGLTHMGQSLANIEDFDDFPLEEDEEGLQEEIVDEYHFGGGFVRKESKGEGEDEDEGEGEEEVRQVDGKQKTRAEVMKEIIQKSKYYKELKQRLHEENDELTEELDLELPSLLEHFTSAGNLKKDKMERDDFDVMVKELAFEPRAYATNRLKKPEEIASEQREKLALLEKERQKRMTSEHFADEDDLEQDEDGEDEEDDGEEDGDEDGEEDGDENGEDEDGEDEDGEEEEDEEEEEGGDLPQKKKRKIEESDGVSADKLEDDYDLGDDNEDEGDGDEDFLVDEKKQKKRIFLSETELQLVDNNLGERSIPFLIDVPDTYEEFYNLFANRPSKDQATIISRIFTSNSASIGANFKPKMEKFCTLLLQHFGKVINNAAGSEEGIPRKEVNIVCIALYHISQQIPEYFTGICKKKLSALNTSLLSHLSNLDDRKERKVWRLADFMYFKLIANIFSVTDFYHPIISPALILMCNFIVHFPTSSVNHLLSKLLLSSFVISYLKEPERYSSEIVYFFDLILSAAIEEEGYSPFSNDVKKFLSAKNRKFDKKANISPLNFSYYFSASPSPTLLWEILNVVVTSIDEMQEIWRSYLIYPELFLPFVAKLTKLSSFSIPPSLLESIEKLIEKLNSQINKVQNTRKPLRFPDAKPIPLPSLIPDFDDTYNPMRKNKENEEDAAKERIKRMKKTVKKETKSAMRELRKDNVFLEKERLKKRKLEDVEREKKVKQIMSDLEAQQHNFNVSKREKKKSGKRK